MDQVLSHWGRRSFVYWSREQGFRKLWLESYQNDLAATELHQGPELLGVACHYGETQCSVAKPNEALGFQKVSRGSAVLACGTGPGNIALAG